MKNNTLALSLVLLPLLFGFSIENTEPSCNCLTPSGANKSAQTSTTITIAWGGVSGATQYRLHYYRSNDNYTSGYVYTSGTSYTFSGITSGQYRFFIISECGSQSSSDIWVDVEQS